MLVADDVSLIDFNYTTDIDSDTYNSVKIYQDNDEAGKREVYQAKDSLTQVKWGILQWYESAPECFNAAQCTQVANQILALKNRVKQSLTVEILAIGLGEEKIRGGSGIMVKIDDLGENSVNNWFIVNNVTHTFKNYEHTVKMDIEEW